MTVYQRICEFEKNNWFRFSQQGKLNIGAHIKKSWNAVAHHNPTLEFVESKEPEGIFQVPNYPDYFTLSIDAMIADYVIRITTPRPRKEPPKKVEKPKQMKHDLPPKTATSEPQRKRTRKPVPVFTTRKK